MPGSVIRQVLNGERGVSPIPDLPSPSHTTEGVEGERGPWTRLGKPEMVRGSSALGRALPFRLSHLHPGLCPARKTVTHSDIPPRGLCCSSCKMGAEAPGEAVRGRGGRGLCHYHLHATFLTRLARKLCEGRFWKEGLLAAQHGELAESHPGWSPEQAAFPVTFHTHNRLPLSQPTGLRGKL